MIDTTLPAEQTTRNLVQNNPPAFPPGENMIFDTAKFQALDAMATIMSSSAVTIPRHLTGNKGDCFAIAMQAAQWGMNPFAVAQKTHLVNGVLGYEAQLVNAVVQTTAPVRDMFRYEWYGEWEKILGKFETRTGKSGNPYQVPAWKPEDEKGLGIRVSATLRGEDEPRVLDLLMSQATVRNSTLWASDPRQQLAYLAVKRWARLYTPGAILGVYSTDELEEDPPMKSVEPVRPEAKPATEKLAEKLGVRKESKKTEPVKAEEVKETEKTVEPVKAEIVPKLSEHIAKVIADSGAPVTMEMITEFLQSKKLCVKYTLDQLAENNPQWNKWCFDNTTNLINNALEFHESKEG